MKPVVFALLLLAVTVSAQARLGEEMSQLASRYGEPLPKPDAKAAASASGPDVETFQRNGFQIEVTLIQGVSARESFKKLNGDPISDQEVNTLLADNAQGFAWQAPHNADGQTNWVRDDGSVATLVGGHVLRMTAASLLNAEAREKQLERAPSLDGF